MIKIAEIFHSLQGEGRFVGVPSVFVRTFGCNLKCAGFGMPKGELSTEAEDLAKIQKSTNKWNEYATLPLVSTGCDSYASWHPAFKDLSPKMDVETIVREAEMARIANHDLIRNDGSTHLVITGGEPLLGWQREYPELIDAFVATGYREITFETNGTQKITDDFADYMLTQKYSAVKSSPNYTFSVSAKLPSSGEDAREALQPETVVEYQKYGEVYLKFVISNRKDEQDALYHVQQYRKAGFTGDVYVMPCGGVTELYNYNAPAVAQIAMSQGWKYSPRLQVDLWSNEWGT